MNMQLRLGIWGIWICGLLLPIVTQGQDVPWLGLQPVTYHDSGTLQGMTTYRLFLTHLRNRRSRQLLRI